jgi:acyl-CoA hydrolase
MNNVLTYRRLVKFEDLNQTGRLFGGRLMEWIDEAAALYAMCQLQTKKIVTLKVSELIFKEPISNGDILEFFASTKNVGRTSFAVEMEVRKKAISNEQSPSLALTCDLTFVTVDQDGHATPNRFYTGPK